MNLLAQKLADENPRPSGDRERDLDWFGIALISLTAVIGLLFALGSR